MRMSEMPKLAIVTPDQQLKRIDQSFMRSILDYWW
ncbi:hypothetical protein ALQ48_04079 [Pseudomonas coronafaciens pv. zizaniae]|nr:hypothetical protein ALQ48_04079 [Pseudomonas coronafaciens pv. zizaniae]